MRPDDRSAQHGMDPSRYLQRNRVNMLFPVVVAAGMLAYVAYLASARRNGDQFATMVTIVERTWPLILVLTFPYLAARALVWSELLEQLCIDVPFRQTLAAFAGGEITKSLPAGVYVQNLLLGRLSRLGHITVVRSAMATTAMLGLESFVAVPVALVIGVPHQPWLFWTLLGAVLAWVGLLILVWILVHYRARHIGPDVAEWRRRLVRGAEEFLDAGRELITRRTAKNLGPTAIYMLIYVVDLYAIIRAAGIHKVSFVDTMGIYALIVLAVILVPIPTEIGITEFTGLGALITYGIPSPTAAIIMLSLRVLATGATILVATALLVVLRQELLAAGRRAPETMGDGPSPATKEM